MCLNDFKASNKQNLIKLFQRKGIVVVDLYPFALATFIYKQGKFNFKETGYQNALEIYYSKIIRFLRLNKKTQIILRYSGLKNRCEFKLFMQLMKRSEPDHIFKGQTANINEIKLVLKKMYSSRGRIKNLRYSRSKNKITARNFSILRLSKTFGDEIKDSTIFSNILLFYSKGQKVFNIASDQYFKPLYVKDLVKIIDIFLKKNIKGVYNVCGNEYISRFNLLCPK